LGYKHCVIYVETDESNYDYVSIELKIDSAKYRVIQQRKQDVGAGYLGEAALDASSPHDGHRREHPNSRVERAVQDSQQQNFLVLSA